MDDHGYPSDENSHWGLSTALAHEMPPEEFEYDNSDQESDLTLKSLAIALIIGLGTIFLVFGVLS